SDQLIPTRNLALAPTPLPNPNPARTHSRRASRSRNPSLDRTTSSRISFLPQPERAVCSPSSRREEGNSSRSTFMRPNKVIATVLLFGLALSISGVARAAEPDARAQKYEGKTLEEWIKLLRGKDLLGQVMALHVLTRLGPKAEPAVPALIETLTDERFFFSMEVADALAAIGKKALPPLLKLLNNDDAAKKRAAMRALKQFGEQAEVAVPTLLELVKSEDVLVAMDAWSTLRGIG